MVKLTAKERGLLKGAIRRVFARSDLRRQVLELTIVKHKDSKRPRVTKWSCCPQCKQLTPTYLMEVDHIDPVIPVYSSLEKMSWDELVSRSWCDSSNLRALCKPCHKKKTKQENKLRRIFKKKGVISL